jgi:hypothetical protein
MRWSTSTKSIRKRSCRSNKDISRRSRAMDMARDTEVEVREAIITIIMDITAVTAAGAAVAVTVARGTEELK